MSTPLHRILYLEPVAARGGAQNLTLALLSRLDRSRFQPVVACLDEGELETDVARLGVPCYTHPGHRTRQLRRTLRAVAWLGGLLRRERIDLIHVCGTKTLVYGGPAARWARIPILWHLFDPPPSPPSWIDQVCRRMPRDRVVAIAGITRDGWGPLVPDDIRVIEPGLELERFESRPPAPSWIREDGPHLLMVARLQGFKGHLELLDALPGVLQVHPRLRLHLVGGSMFGLEPGYVRTVRSRIQRPDLNGRVILHGYLEERDLVGLMAHCDLLVHPPLQEPFGLVVAEAMAWGRPVVATRSGGPDRIVDDGRTGRLVRPGDPAALTRGILEVLGDPERAASWGEAGRERIHREFSIDRMARALEAVYAEMLP